MSKILIISSNIHKELSSKQLSLCLEFTKKYHNDYQIEVLEAGCYEIPFVINTYHQHNPFDGYIALGLMLNTNPFHFEYVMSHIKHCFSHFALNNIVVGNGIITGTSVEDLESKIVSDNPCVSAYPSAVNAVEALVDLKRKFSLSKAEF